MPELNEADAKEIMMGYYGKQCLNYKIEDIEKIMALLRAMDAIGLVIYAYARGVLDTRGEK